MKIFKPSQTTLLIIVLIVLIAITIMDFQTPIGYSHWILYILPILLIFPAENAFLTYLILAITVPALVLGYVGSPLLSSCENIRVISLVNRILGFTVLLIFTVIINKLIQSRKHYKVLSSALEYANNELESFSYSAAHDLKAPLHAVKGYSQILIEDYGKKLDTIAIDYIGRIILSSDKMTNLIDDMLSLSKISMKDMDIQEVNMSAMAEAIVAELKATAPERNVEIHIDKGMKARADKRLIKIALENLIGNAWKYTSKKEFAVISVEKKQTKNETLFSIKDNGSGFDMKYAKNLFAPFKRLHAETEFKGTGIGLSIVERVIRRHNGRVWAESELNKGATFYFALPR